MTRLEGRVTGFFATTALMSILCLMVPVAGSAQSVEEADGELRLTTADPDHVSGQYSREGVVIRFDSVVSGDRKTLNLATISGETLMTATSDRTTYEIELLNGRLRMTGQLQDYERDDGEPEVQGDEGAAQDLFEIPEYRVLPYLSRALGDQGIGGNTHPASMPIHLVAMGSADATGITLASGMELLAEPLAGNQDPSTSDSKCLDQRGDPCQDDCFGMCGPGCECWHRVCGTCCTCNTCLWHDERCEEWNCFRSRKGWAGCFAASPLVLIAPCSPVKEKLQ